MPAYSGKFQYVDAGGAPVQQGNCEISFDAETAVVTPAGGLPLAFDLGDVDEIAPGEWELRLRLYTGKSILLRQFGAAFSRLCAELVAAWRDRTVRCLLLEDLKEVARFQGTANGAPAEIRLCGSNLAVLPLGGRALQWRMAEVDSVAFDDATYSFHLRSGGAQLVLGRLAAKTGEFRDKLEATRDGLRRHAAEVLHQTFPFLDADRLQQLVALAPEGRSVKLAALADVHADLPDALLARAVSEAHRPYFDSLQKRSTADSVMTGFKFVWPDEDTDAAAEDGQPAETGDAAQPLFFWFFFPLAGRNVAAWEATTGSGRATYLFRADPPVEEAIARLTSGLALVNFRREPVYLPDETLEREAQYHRYAIGRRKLPDLAALRAAFLGRAIHSSLAAWESQIEQASGAGGR